MSTAKHALFCLLMVAVASSLPVTAQEPSAPVVPPAGDVLKNGGMFELFLEVAGDANLKAQLNGDGPLTLFVPRDQAFDELDQETRDALRDPANKALLARLIRYHMVGDNVGINAEIWKEGADVDSLSGEKLTLKKNGTRFTLNGNVRVIKADIPSGNAVIHIIDKVLLPPEFKVALESAKPAKSGKPRKRS